MGESVVAFMRCVCQGVCGSMCVGFTCLFILASRLALALAFLSVYTFVHVSVSMCVLRPMNYYHWLTFI